MASRSHGVVTRPQLLEAGVTSRQIEVRLGSGALIPVHRGVYRVGHRAPSVEAQYLAAALACGEGALLSGPPAAYLLRLLKGRPPTPEVSTPAKRRVRGLTVRRAGGLEDDAITWRGIPVTSVPRTLVDLAGDTPVDDLARVCHEAGVLYRTTPAMVKAVLERRPCSRGAPKLWAVMLGDTPAVLSRLERGGLALIKDEGLSRPPHVNRSASGRRVDFRWPEQRLTVELDSYRYHNSRYSWEQDRKREREARRRGDEFRRYTWGDVFEDSTLMRAELRALLLPAG
jgi:Transcriptional regulator, AbiEi antitoxin